MAPGVFVSSLIAGILNLLKSENMTISWSGEMPLWISHYRTGRHFGSTILIAHKRIKI